jgi:hypothetical protein
MVPAPVTVRVLPLMLPAPVLLESMGVRPRIDVN